MKLGCLLKDWQEKPEECMGKVQAVAEFVKDMSNKNIILSGSRLDGADPAAVAVHIEKEAKHCLEIGVALNYHNHAWEFENNAEVFNSLVEHAPSLKFALDLGWVYKGGLDPIETVKKYSDRIRYVHLRDAAHREDKEFVPFGEGIFDFPTLMGVLEEVLGQDGWAVVEYEHGDEDFERYTKAKIFLDGIK